MNNKRLAFFLLACAAIAPAPAQMLQPLVAATAAPVAVVSPVALVASTCGGGGVESGSTSSIDTTGADFLVISTGYYTLNGAPIITDSASNSIAPLTQYKIPGDLGGQLFYIQNPTTSASHTFSWTSSGSQIYNSLCIAAFSHMKTSGVFDTGKDNGNADGSGPTIQPGSITPPGDATHLVIVGGTLNLTGGTLSIDSGFTIASQLAMSGGLNFANAIAYLVESTGGAPSNPTLTGSGAGGIVVEIASFGGGA